MRQPLSRRLNFLQLYPGYAVLLLLAAFFAFPTLAHAQGQVTVSVTACASSIYPQQTDSLTATLTITDDGIIPAGDGETITFYAGTNPIGTATLTEIDANDSSASLTINGSQLVVGPNSITAVYVGDTNYSPSTSTPITVTVLSPVVNMGTAYVGVPASPQTLTYSFTVPTTLTSVNVLTSGIAGLDYTNNNGTCAAGDYTPGQTCTVVAAFTPTAPGARAGAAMLYQQGSNLPLMTWYLAGIGQSGAVAMDPGTLTVTALTGTASPIVYGSAVDGAGNVYVVDRANGAVIELAAITFSQSTVVTGLSSPTGVALDGAGDLYISNGSSVVMVPNENGTLTPLDQTTVNISGLGDARGIAVDNNDNLYVADAANGDVVELSALGVQTTIAQGLTDPHGIAVDANGNLYVAINSGVFEYPYPFDGGMGIQYGGGFSNPRGVAVDAAGAVYVADTGNGQIVEVAPGGISQSIIVIPGPSAPQGVSLDSSDNLYVTFANSLIQDNRMQPAQLIFPVVPVNSYSTPQNVTVSDSGNDQVQITNLGVSTNFLQVPSPLGNDCSSSTLLMMADQCSIRLEFLPTAGGMLTGTAALTDNALGNPSSMQVVQLSGSSSLLTQSITFTSAPPSAVFNAQFTVAASSGSGLPVAFSSSGPCTNSGATFTVTSGSGTCTVIANQSGNAQYSAAPQVTQSVALTPATSTVGLASSVNASVYDQYVTFAATITPQYGGLATGTVTFQDGATIIGVGNVSSNVAYFSSSVLSVGTHLITASYSGDANVAASSSNSLAQIVNHAGVSATVGTSSNPANAGQPIIFTVTVSPQFPGNTPTGTVTLKKNGVALQTSPLVSGQVIFSISGIALGSYTITALYNGDANFAPATSPGLVQAVAKIVTFIALTSSANPSTTGQPVTFTAIVSSGSGPPPDGELVTFSSSGTSLGTSALVGGTASITTSSLAIGNRSIKAAYAGDADYSSSNSALLTEKIAALGTVTSLTSSGSPANFHQTITFTATVTSNSGGMPTGTVTFKNGGATLGTAALSNGATTFDTSTLTAGTHTITAIYNGDSLNATSTSAAISQIVNKAPYPQVTPSVTQINFTSGSGLMPGQSTTVPVTFTVVSGPIIMKQKSPTAKPLVGGDDYTSEGDDITQDSGCIGTWQVGDTCTINYTFTADSDDQGCNPANIITVAGTKTQVPPYGCTGTVQFTIPNSPNPVMITYTAVVMNADPSIAISSVTVTFPNTVVGEYSQADATISNAGNVPLNITNIAVTSNPTVFSQTNNCPASLLPQQSCDVTATFTPLKVGSITGVITLTDNDTTGNAPKQIHLKGTAVSP